MYNLCSFFVPLCRLRDNRGRGVALTVGQGMQFAAAVSHVKSGWRLFYFDYNTLI